MDIKDLSISVSNDAQDYVLLNNISFDLVSGEKVGLIGESGSGKSMLARAILGLNFHVKHLTQKGQILWSTEADYLDLNDSSAKKLAHIRNSEIGIVFQHSAQVLNPGKRIGEQLLEKIEDTNRGESIVMKALSDVELIPAERYYNAYPHQLSGGQVQRALIALALINEPKLIIADEPLSALDSKTQQQLILLLQRLVTKQAVALLIISHDLSQVFELCDRIIVLENGEIVEQGKIDGIMDSPRSELTKAFVSSHSQVNKPEVLSGGKEIIVKVEDVNLSYISKKVFFGNAKKSVAVLSQFNLEIYQGEILGLYGKSGSGKSSLARLILRLENPDTGAVYFKGEDIFGFDKQEMLQFRHQAQIIFQDPFSAMSPHRSVRQHFIDAGLAMNLKLSEEKIILSLEKVGLPSAYLERYPKQLSGGERQRILIARALFMEVEFLICDEILASLDVKVSMEILNILTNLVQLDALTILFISHDQEVLDRFCHRIISLDE